MNTGETEVVGSAGDVSELMATRTHIELREVGVVMPLFPPPHSEVVESLDRDGARVGLVEVSSLAEPTQWDSGAQFFQGIRVRSSDTSGLRGAVPMVESSRASHIEHSGSDTDSVEWILDDNGVVVTLDTEPKGI